MAEDEHGNSYFVASCGNSIAKVNCNGAVTSFYHPSAATINDHAYGFTGLASYCNSLIAADTITSPLYRLDTTSPFPSPIPIPTPTSPQTKLSPSTPSIRLPNTATQSCSSQTTTIKVSAA
jgi:hypothetical protein